MPRTGSGTAAGLVTALVAALALLTGCGADDARNSDDSAPPEPSAPAASETTAATEPPAASETPSPSPGFEGDPALAALDPCALVDAAGLGSLGLTGGEPETLGQARVCRYRFEGPTLPESFTVSVEFFGTSGLDDLDDLVESVEAPAPVGAHEARRFIDITGGCGVAIGVGATSRVDATAVGGDQELACAHASALAAAIEPALP